MAEAIDQRAHLAEVAALAGLAVDPVQGDQPLALVKPIRNFIG